MNSKNILVRFWLKMRAGHHSVYSEKSPEEVHAELKKYFDNNEFDLSKVIKGQFISEIAFEVYYNRTFAQLTIGKAKLEGNILPFSSGTKISVKIFPEVSLIGIAIAVFSMGLFIISLLLEKANMDYLWVFIIFAFIILIPLLLINVTQWDKENLLMHFTRQFKLAHKP